jgi:hypothetical protein
LRRELRFFGDGARVACNFGSPAPIAPRSMVNCSLGSVLGYFAFRRLLQLLGHSPLMVRRGDNRSFPPTGPRAIPFVLAIDAVSGERQRFQTFQRNQFVAPEASAVLARVGSCECFIEELELFFRARDQSGVSFDLFNHVRGIHLVARI